MYTYVCPGKDARVSMGEVWTTKSGQAWSYLTQEGWPPCKQTLIAESSRTYATGRSWKELKMIEPEMVCHVKEVSSGGNPQGLKELMHVPGREPVFAGLLNWCHWKWVSVRGVDETSKRENKNRHSGWRRRFNFLINESITNVTFHTSPSFIITWANQLFIKRWELALPLEMFSGVIWSFQYFGDFV